MSKSLNLILAGALALLFAHDAAACGSSLFGVGQRARFHQARTGETARVLIYADRTGAGAEAVGSADMHTSLQKAGHHVTVVGDPEALAGAIARGPWDVVIADFEDVAAIQASLLESAKQPEILPVVDRRAGTEQLARATFQWCVRASAGAGQYLRLVQKVMAARLP